MPRRCSWITVVCPLAAPPLGVAIRSLTAALITIMLLIAPTVVTVMIAVALLSLYALGATVMPPNICSGAAVVDPKGSHHCRARSMGVPGYITHFTVAPPFPPIAGGGRGSPNTPNRCAAPPIIRSPNACNICAAPPQQPGALIHVIYVQP